jgi:putative flippase GtrA
VPFPHQMGRRLLSFQLIGAGVALFGFALMALLVDGLGVHPTPAYAVQAVVSISLSFWLNRRFTWPDRHVRLRNALGRFLATRIVTLPLNQVVFNLLIWLGLWYLLAQAVGIVITACVNYVFGDRIVFRAVTSSNTST